MRENINLRDHNICIYIYNILYTTSVIRELSKEILKTYYNFAELRFAYYTKTRDNKILTHSNRLSAT